MRIFEEKQRFTQWWLYLLSVVVIIGVLYTAYDWWSSNQGNIDTSSAEFYLILSAPILSLIALSGIHLLNLQTEIDERGIHYRFFPLHMNKKTISWQEIDTVHTREYSPIKEYGGWGIRGISKKNRAYNIKGNQGIQLVLKNGNRLLFGTQKPDEAQQVINRYSK